MTAPSRARTGGVQGRDFLRDDERKEPCYHLGAEGTGEDETLNHTKYLIFRLFHQGQLFINKCRARLAFQISAKITANRFKTSTAKPYQSSVTMATPIPIASVGANPSIAKELQEKLLPEYNSTLPLSSAVSSEKKKITS